MRSEVASYCFLMSVMVLFRPSVVVLKIPSALVKAFAAVSTREPMPVPLVNRDLTPSRVSDRALDNFASSIFSSPVLGSVVMAIFDRLRLLDGSNDPDRASRMRVWTERATESPVRADEVWASTL